MKKQYEFEPENRSVPAMAKKLGLSHARFYQLLAQGYFPSPIYYIGNQLPFYHPYLQEICRQVRQSARGYNGRVLIFCDISLTIEFSGFVFL